MVALFFYKKLLTQGIYLWYNIFKNWLQIPVGFVEKFKSKERNFKICKLQHP